MEGTRAFEIMPNGKISLLLMYRLRYFLQTGDRVFVRTTKVPAKERKLILERYGLIYNRHAQQYIGNEDNIFNILKEEFPIVFEKYDITDWCKLMYIFETTAR